VTVKIEVELYQTLKTPDDIETRLRYLWDSNSTQTADFNLFLMRTAGASGWELKKLEVIDSETH
jgi:hypothetical protein